MGGKTNESDSQWKEKRKWEQIWKTGLSNFAKGKTSVKCLIPQCVAQRGCTIPLEILENHLDPPRAGQFNLDDLQRWLPASTILSFWVFSNCLLSHYWEHLKKEAKNHNPTKQKNTPPQPNNVNTKWKKKTPPNKTIRNKSIILYVKRCDHNLCQIAKNFE